MIRWPWSKPERRASYTDSVVSALLSAASGKAASATATAAVEAAAGAVARGFAAASIEGAPGPVADALGPHVLARIGRDLIRHGDSIHVIQTAGGALRLAQAGAWDIRGGPDPAQWWVRADLFGPSGNVTRLVQHAGVVHCRYAVDPARPWIGVGPLQWASMAGDLHAGVVASLAADMRAASAYAVPMPPGENAGEESDDPLDGLRAALLKAKGKSVFVESTRGGFGGDHRDAPARDWKQERLGADPPESLAMLHDATANVVLAACGVDPVIVGFGKFDGSFAREGFRRFERLTLRPLARIVEAELRAKLDAPGLTLDFGTLRASDFAGIARAYKALVESGLSPAEAAGQLDMET
ncbi:MAG: hypothetical protein J4F40_15805 [Alphaproteobacteria bacterium]|nr:hypothetical protein [Alphaproteobacteria bacterium]